MLENIKNKANIILDETLSRMIIFRLDIEELKVKKKKEVIDMILGTRFEIDKNKSTSVKSLINKIENDIEITKKLSYDTKKNISNETNSIVKNLEIKIYSSLTKILDKIELLEKNKNDTTERVYSSLSKIVDRLDSVEKKLKSSRDELKLYSKTFFCKSNTSAIVIKEHLEVKKYLDYHKLDIQQSLFQVYVEGILQINDTIDKGDYMLTKNDNDELVVVFHETITTEATISIFSVKSY